MPDLIVRSPNMLIVFGDETQPPSCVLTVLSSRFYPGCLCSFVCTAWFRDKVLSLKVMSLEGKTWSAGSFEFSHHAEVRRLRRTAQKPGREELTLAQGQGRGPRGATPHPRSGRAAERSYPMSKEWRLCRRRRAKRSYSTFKVRRGGREEIPFFQGKEQGLCFAGAAVKRYPTSKVRETK